MRYFKSSILMLTVCASALTACQTTSQNKSMGLSHNGSSENYAIYKNINDISQDPFVISMMGAAKKAEEDDRMQEAAVFAAKAYDREPENAEIGWRYGRLLRMNNRSKQAAELLTPYSVRDEVSSHLLREYAAALLSSGDIVQAYAETKRMALQKPKSPHSWNVMGVIADAYGEQDEAIKYFNEGLSYVAKGDERQRAILLNNMALAYAQKGDGKQAYTYAKKALTGAQYYPQIKENYETLKGWPTNQPADADDNAPEGGVEASEGEDRRVDTAEIEAEITTDSGVKADVESVEVEELTPMDGTTSSKNGVRGAEPIDLVNDDVLVMQGDPAAYKAPLPLQKPILD